MKQIAPDSSNTNGPDLVSWYGKNINDLTREELLDAFKQLARAYENDRKFHISSMRFMRDLKVIR